MPGGRDLSVLVKRSLAPRTRRATSAHANASHVIARLREDYVAKDEASAYAGGATRRWLKVKQKGWAVAEDRWQRRIRVTLPATS